MTEVRRPKPPPPPKPRDTRDLSHGALYRVGGGLVYSQLTEIPADGDQPTVTCYGLKIKVEEISDRRVEWAIVEKLPEEDGQE